MNFAECAIKYRVLSFIVMVLSVAGGWSAYQSMPRFEDPGIHDSHCINLHRLSGRQPAPSRRRNHPAAGNRTAGITGSGCH